MKTTDILMIAAAAYAAYLLYGKWRVNNANTVINLGAPINGISEIFSGAKAGQKGFGWRYFSDGTSISPDGTYYLNGKEVWRR